MSKPRVGFLGTGWIGRHRMAAMLATGAIEAAAICDPDPECAAEGVARAADAKQVASFDALLAERLDGIVIATPSALHASQSITALESGAAVFCQKPLGRDAAETRAVIDAARRADRLLAVDLSYRRTAAVEAVAQAVRSGTLGEVFAVDLTFHNAYGPGKPWFFDRARSGGGCVIDLGVHLVDLALWLLDFPRVGAVDARLFAKGRPLAPGAQEVEDYATARIDLAGGTSVGLACSWNLHAGCEAVIGAMFHGTQAGAGFRNIGGSFYDFEAVLNRGTAREVIASPPDDWGGRVAADWAEQLARNNRYDAGVESVAIVAETLDRIYGAG